MPEAEVNTLYRLPVESYEAAARRLCTIRAIDPDAFIRTDPAKPMEMKPRWELAADMLRTHDEMTRALIEPSKPALGVISG